MLKDLSVPIMILFSIFQNFVKSAGSSVTDIFNFQITKILFNSFMMEVSIKQKLVYLFAEQFSGLVSV